MVAAREPISHGFAKAIPSSHVELMFSGDLSFSYLMGSAYQPIPNIQVKNLYPRIQEAVKAMREYGDDWVTLTHSISHSLIHTCMNTQAHYPYTS